MVNETTVSPLEKAIEPQGWISEAFEKMEEHLTEQDSKFLEQDKKMTDIQFRLDRVDGKLEVILEHLLKISDLPEE